MTFNIIAALLFVVPFIDRGPENRRRHLIFNVIGVVALLYIVVMTIVGYVAK
jgi:quinol-cytochrome oxidoreductase complex cytochrome b subunit